ncbi:unnamed protein product [Adineta steineri]|uniref:Uncharacterized protein n=1 Tax=Adineta steineri TaxID=433720 RepID=A0A816FD80_9BILA|nr:unnamed protein product [Adineta steineri]CAF1659914.1 unnamed protein product [Adineta steineri]
MVSNETLKVSYFSSKPFFGVLSFKKGFAGKGSSPRYTGRSFNGFVEFFIVFFKLGTCLETISSRRNLFWEFSRPPILLRVYIIILPSNFTLQFNYKDVPVGTDPVSYALYSSDLDITQAALKGSQLLCTFAFLQAVVTKSFICYTMHANREKSICNRIIRYCQRGFTFLEPYESDSLLIIDIMNGTILLSKKKEVYRTIFGSVSLSEPFKVLQNITKTNEGSAQ